MISANTTYYISFSEIQEFSYWEKSYLNTCEDIKFESSLWINIFRLATMFAMQAKLYWSLFHELHIFFCYSTCFIQLTYFMNI